MNMCVGPYRSLRNPIGNEFKVASSRGDEADDLLDLAIDRSGQRPRACRTIGKHPVDIGVINLEAPLFRGDRRELGDRQLDESLLEGGELIAALLTQHIRNRAAGE